MKPVYEHHDSGALYALVEGDLGKSVGLYGQRLFTLAPVRRLVDATTREPAERPNTGDYALLHENHALRLVVNKQELADQFRLLDDVRALQNSPIEELIAHYESEECDFTDLASVAATALHYLERGAEDSQLRCLAYVLAKHVKNAHATP